MSRLRISHALFAVALPAMAAGTFESVLAPDRIPVSGVFSMRYSQQHALPAANPAGPVLLLNEATGTNRNTGKSEFMDGARVIIREIADLTQGNGPHQGYITETMSADTTLTRWHGTVVTTLGPDQKPATRFEGTWSKVSGTGKYHGVAGSGTYRGRMVSPSEFTVEWNGEIQLQRAASR